MDDIENVLKERFLLQQEYLGDDKPVNNITPLVSVTVATYQHVNYIRECLDGILMQKTNFLYEIILGEDGSVDGTQDVCIEYATNYPDKIRLFIRDRALSQYIASDGRVVRFNGIWNRMSTRGKYIAWCEGDDYWTDPYKLQKQVDFLEQNPDYGLICTDVDFYNQSNGKFLYNYFKTKKYPIKYNYKDFLLNLWFIAPCTWVFRKSLYHLINPNFIVGDLPILLEISSKSKIKYLSETTAVYRVLKESASHRKSFNEYKKYYEGVFQIQKYYAEINHNLDCVPLLMQATNMVLLKYSLKYGNIIYSVYYLYNLFLLKLKNAYLKLKKLRE